jgi:hypothetical protein
MSASVVPPLQTDKYSLITPFKKHTVGNQKEEQETRPANMRNHVPIRVGLIEAQRIILNISKRDILKTLL